jgi:hypothetical protein
MPNNDRITQDTVKCGGLKIEELEQFALCLSSIYLLAICGRQLYHSSTKQAADTHVLPLHFRLFAAACFAVFFFSACVLYYASEPHLPYWLAGLTQALVAGISMVVSLFLAQDGPGSRSIRNSIYGGCALGVEKFLFEVYIRFEMSGADSARTNQGTDIAWMVQDGSQALAFALVLMYARRNGQPRPGVHLICAFQAGIFSSFVVQGVFFYERDDAIAQCWQLGNLSLFFILWPWVAYSALQRDSSYWRTFALFNEAVASGHGRGAAAAGCEGEEERKRALLELSNGDLYETVKVLDYCRLHLGQKIGEVQYNTHYAHSTPY